MDRMNPASTLADPASSMGSESLMHAQVALQVMQAVTTPRERIGRIVRAIEQDIIPRLVKAHRQPVAVPVPPVRPRILPTDLQALMPLVLGQDEADCQVLITQLLDRGIAVDEIYTELLAPAARELGRLWDEDRCDFADVTVGTGRLQRLMRTLSPSFGRAVPHPQDGRRVLLAVAPGEQHTFGLSIVAEFFRRSGWEVVGDSESQARDPVVMVRREWFDVVGLSIGIESRLDWVKSGITAIRGASRNRGLGVMVGGSVFQGRPGLATELGADGTAIDGRTAPQLAESLLEQRVQRL